MVRHCRTRRTGGSRAVNRCVLRAGIVRGSVGLSLDTLRRGRDRDAVCPVSARTRSEWTHMSSIGNLRAARLLSADPGIGMCQVLQYCSTYGPEPTSLADIYAALPLADRERDLDDIRGHELDACADMARYRFQARRQPAVHASVLPALSVDWWVELGRISPEES